MDVQIDKADWIDWKANPCTKQYVKAMFHSREMIKEGIAEGEASDERTLYVAIGRAQGIKDAINYILQNTEEELTDGL